MTSNLNIGDLGRLAQSLLDKETKGQEFMLEDVYNVTRAAYERFPEDPVINQVAFTIEKMATKSQPGATINQAEISKIFNEFVRLSDNSKFRETLGFLLLEDKPTAGSQNPDYSRLNRVDAEDSQLNTDDFIDKGLVNAISAAFGGSIDKVKAFDAKTAEKGVGLVKAELKALGFDKTNVEVMGGNPHNIVYAAHFETRKGRVTVAIPTEINEGRVLFPSTFVADDHLEELTPTNLSYFVDTKTESENFNVPRAADVLSAVSILSGQAKLATDDDLAKLNEAFGEEREQEIDLATSNLFVDRQYEEGRPDIDTKQSVEMPAELAHLSRDFENDILEAASVFGLETIRKGKEMLARELRAAGFKNAQVKFGSEASDSVVFLAVINTPKGPAEIEVPVEMQCVAEDKHVPLAPSYFAYDGLIEDFTHAKLQRFAISLPAPSSGEKSYSTSYSYMTLPELKDEILKAASENDYVTCEYILDEIQENFNEEDFKNAVADYQYILMHKARLDKQEQRSCSKMIAAGKGSIYARCGHFGIPMHQVVVDEQGNCRMKTAVEREKLNPTKEGGASMSSAKVFMS